MVPVMQKVVDPGKGDCMRACIASILELPADAVPNFLEELEKGVGWFECFDTFLRSHGLEYHGQQPPTLAMELSEGLDGYYMATVPSLNFPDKTHAVVFHRDKFVHDPSPLQSKAWTIEDVRYFYMIERKAEGGN